MSDIFDLFNKISSSSKKTGPIEYLVVGLGNPGKQYENTKHNVGFCTIDYIADKLGVKIDRVKFKALTCEAIIEEKRVLLVKPQTFMNLSGQAVREAAKFHKISAENIIIIYDDISLDPGKIRIRKKGSAGGHNGIKSIITELGEDNFPRIKVGVGAKPSNEWDLADWVLAPFSAEAKKNVESSFERSYSSLKLMLEKNYDKAMNLYNS